MVLYFGLVELSMYLENTVELERQMFEVFARLFVNLLLLSLRTQIFLQWVVQKKEYMKRNLEMNIVDIVDLVDMVDKEVESLTRGT